MKLISLNRLQATQYTTINARIEKNNVQIFRKRILAQIYDKKTIYYCGNFVGAIKKLKYRSKKRKSKF